MTTAHIHARGLVFERDDGHALIVIVDITCPECGDYTIVLPGHHVRDVLRALQRMADLKPELTPEGEVIEEPVSIQRPGLN